MEGRGLAKAATLISLGNIVSRVVGLLRDVTIAHFFGATSAVSAFRTAEFLPRQFYDLLVGGMISSALVPVLSELAKKDKKLLWRVASLLLSLAVVVLGAGVLLAELGAPWIAALLGGNDLDLALVTRLLRITMPAMLFLSLSGILTGLLHALRRFTFPAFTAATFNASIVLATLIGVAFFNNGIETVALGLVIGAIAQILIQLPGLKDARLGFQFDLRHPVLSRIGRLYQPVIVGLLVTLFQTSLDRRLANSTGESSLAWMQNATALIQFPMGLVVVAISLATLPTLSRYAAEAIETGAASEAGRRFMATLTSSLKTVLILIIPATVALWILGQPIIALLFEHGDFTPLDTAQTYLALRFYLLGLIFAAVDQPLIFAYYARQNTFTPAMVGIISVGVYLASVYLPQLVRPLQMTDLVLADSIKHLGHMVIMLWLINRLSSLRGGGLGVVALKSGLAAGLMGLLLWGILAWLSPRLPPVNLLNELLLVGLPALAGGSLYVILIWFMKIEEVSILADLLTQRLKG
jgi:putative peptidoglycan lipid II flippase